MTHAVSFALLDSVNALLIGILVAIGIMLPRRKYRWIAGLVILGDWLGVLVAAAVVMFVLLGVREQIAAILDSPIAGGVLIIVGIALAFGAWHSQGKPNALIGRMLQPLRTPSATTVLIGFVMGLVQSLTSVPFYFGLMFLATEDLSLASQYGGLLWYAALALSLPVICALFIAVVRAHPDSAAGRVFAAARDNSTLVALIGGYVVAAFLIILGVVNL
ncbi:hypothetical protein GWO58_01035 [Corynebacterium macginleyi]|uniref:hypothetical protein n=1 Tax=Corynebacterium macginleyi TaxID=38290 RepID=UPI00190B2CF4|nr:hypothetical protein [Corynebacterium macginleyi]MBK4145468.1 hypothetical protein [Corynebacterium macginleyi]